MTTHNICFHGEIRIILCEYSLLSGPSYLSMQFTVQVSQRLSTLWVSSQVIYKVVWTSLKKVTY